MAKGFGPKLSGIEFDGLNGAHGDTRPRAPRPHASFDYRPSALQSLLADGGGGSAAESESELLPGSKLAEQLAQPPEHFHMHRWS